MGSHTQQRELWIYLVITWWIGSLAAWLMAWFSASTTQPNDSLLTASGLLVFGVAACLRLPVLTTPMPTSSIEDHFVWLLAASANVNWIGYLSLYANSVTAVIPSVLIGVALEWWLWNQASRADCLLWARSNILKLISGNTSALSVLNPQASFDHTGSKALPNPLLAETSAASKSIESRGVDQAMEERPIAEPCQDRNIVQRTHEDGIDPTGRRYMAGEVSLDWQPDQRTQTIVIGFVPAFSGDPQVELEVNCDQCTAQIINCTPIGLRIQLKREASASELTTNLSWYARQIDNVESLGPACQGGSLN